MMMDEGLIDRRLNTNTNSGQLQLVTAASEKERVIRRGVRKIPSEADRDASFS